MITAPASTPRRNRLSAGLQAPAARAIVSKRLGSTYRSGRLLFALIRQTWEAEND